MPKMLRLILVLALSLTAFLPVNAQNRLNAKADNILGEYKGTHSGEAFKVRVTKDADGTYKAQMFWVQNDRDEYGRKILDPKNPDKSLRKVPCDRIVIITGLRYDTERQHWGDTKIYDPTRGIRAKVTAHFDTSGRLCVRGTLFGIGETLYWQRIQ